MSRKKRNKKFPRNYCPINEVECLKTNNKGKGIIFFNNKEYIIDGLIPKEKAYVQIFFEDENHGEGKILKLVQISAKRKLPFNHPKLELGSYQLAHLKDKEQDLWKENKIKKIFNLKTINPIIVGNRINYRNKVVIHNGGFSPIGSRRKKIIFPTKENFDLMDFDFSPFHNTYGDIIIRKFKNQTIIGKPGENKELIHKSLGKKFIVNLNSFYQVNIKMAEKAYKDIINWVPKNAIVFDLFAGGAIIGIHVSDKVKKIYSVEINKNSYQDALKNIELNNINNIEMIKGDANSFATQNNFADVIIIDPARSGLSEISTKAINNSKAKRIIYLSCNIETQKRDIDLMDNYKITHMQSYDFFPQTFHIENLIILDSKK